MNFITTHRKGVKVMEMKGSKMLNVEVHAQEKKDWFRSKEFVDIDSLFEQAYLDFNPDRKVLELLVEQNSKVFPAKGWSYVEPELHEDEGEKNEVVVSESEIGMRKLVELNSAIPCKIYRREGRVGKYVKTVPGTLPNYDNDIPREKKEVSSLKGAKSSCMSCAYLTMCNMPEEPVDFSHRVRARSIRRPYCMKKVFPAFTNWEVINKFRMEPDMETIQEVSGWLDAGWEEQLQETWNILTAYDLRQLRSEHVRYIIANTEEIFKKCKFARVWDKKVKDGEKEVEAWFARMMNWVR